MQLIEMDIEFTTEIAVRYCPIPHKNQLIYCLLLHKIIDHGNFPQVFLKRILCRSTLLLSYICCFLKGRLTSNVVVYLGWLYSLGLAKSTLTEHLYSLVFYFQVGLTKFRFVIINIIVVIKDGFTQYLENCSENFFEK